MSLSILLFALTKGVSQTKIPTNWNIFQKQPADRWVMTIQNLPDFYLNSSLKFDTSFKTNIDELSSITFGATAVRYSPKRRFTFGGGLNYNYLVSEIYGFNSLYRYDIQSVGSTVFIGIQKPSIEKSKHPFINIGLTQRYIFNQNLHVFDNKLTNYSKPIGLNSFPTLGYFEIGIRQDKFLRWNHRSSLENLSLAIDFPFFDRSNLFSTNRNKHNPSTIGFLHATNSQYAVRFNYQQFIDFSSKMVYDKENIKKLSATNKKTFSQFLPPLVSIEDPDKRLFGRFFIDFGFSNLKDSINVAEDKTKPTLLHSALLNQIGIGYNVHFGNYSEFSEDASARIKDLYYDAFGGITVFKQILTSSTISLIKYQSIGLKTDAGIRIGNKKGVYALGGLSYQLFELSKKVTENANETKTGIQSPFKDKLSYYAGISYKNMITFKLIHTNTDFMRINPVKYFDNVYYSISIGF